MAVHSDVSSPGIIYIHTLWGLLFIRLGDKKGNGASYWLLQGHWMCSCIENIYIIFAIVDSTAFCGSEPHQRKYIAPLRSWSWFEITPIKKQVPFTEQDNWQGIITLCHKIVQQNIEKANPDSTTAFVHVSGLKHSEAFMCVRHMFKWLPASMW